MPPLPSRKKRVSSASTHHDSPTTAAPMRTAADTPRGGALYSTPLKDMALTPKSPFRRVNDGRITKSQKQALLDNLELELNERTRKIRSQVAQQSHALKQRIEMRLNRVPRKFWKMTMAELLRQAEAPEVANALLDFGGARGFVDEIRRERLVPETTSPNQTRSAVDWESSHGKTEKAKDERLVVTKKRIAHKPTMASIEPPPAAASTVISEEMPPPPAPAPASAVNPTVLSTQSTLRSPSPAVSQKGPARARKVVPSATPDSRASSRSTTRSSTEAPATQNTAPAAPVTTIMRGTKSAQLKARAVAATAAAAANNAAALSDSTAKGLKRGGGGNNNTGSNGSLKENRVAGVKKEGAGKAATGRVLRSRK